MEYLHDTMATREAEQYKLPSPIPVTEQDLLEYCQTRTLHRFSQVANGPQSDSTS
jgi:hypothetical protein